MNRSKKAFTLTIILGALIILAVLGTVVIPRFTAASEHLKLLELMANLQLIREQVELYKMHHNETYPTNINAQLMGKTDNDGRVSAIGMFGPYLRIFPANPFIDDEAKAVKTSGAASAGWFYNPSTGVIVANTPGHGDL